MQRIPVDEAGNPMYEEAGIVDVIDDLYNNQGLEPDEADAFVLVADKREYDKKKKAR